MIWISGRRRLDLYLVLKLFCFHTFLTNNAKKTEEKPMTNIENGLYFQTISFKWIEVDFDLQLRKMKQMTEELLNVVFLKFILTSCINGVFSFARHTDTQLNYRIGKSKDLKFYQLCECNSHFH